MYDDPTLALGGGGDGTLFLSLVVSPYEGVPAVPASSFFPYLRIID